ncbi:hypothetical protein H671_2g5953, partial [Cricetulus griseus]
NWEANDISSESWPAKVLALNWIILDFSEVGTWSSWSPCKVRQRVTEQLEPGARGPHVKTPCTSEAGPKGPRVASDLNASSLTTSSPVTRRHRTSFQMREATSGPNQLRCL